MSKEKEFIDEIKNMTSHILKVEELEKKHSSYFLCQKTIKLNIDNLVTSYKLALDLSVFVISLVVFLYFIMPTFTDFNSSYTFFSSFFCYSLIVPLLNTLVNFLFEKNFFKIKTKVFLFHIKNNKTDRHIYLRKRAAFQKDKKEIIERIYKINNIKKQLRKDADKLDSQAVVDEYLKAIHEDDFLDEKYIASNFLLDEFPMLFQPIIVLKIKNRVKEKIIID